MLAANDGAVIPAKEVNAIAAARNSFFIFVPLNSDEQRTCEVLVRSRITKILEFFGHERRSAAVQRVVFNFVRADMLAFEAVYQTVKEAILRETHKRA